MPSTNVSTQANRNSYMKTVFLRTISMFVLVCLTVTSLLGCQHSPAPTETESAPTSFETAAPTGQPLCESVDYAGSISLNMSSETAKQEVTVKTFVDGDTTHFLVPESVHPDGVLKARYLAINTPESTGKVEEYGKAASKFTKEKLSSAQSIIIESETDRWNPDSTGGRYLVWVWYRTSETEEYRNLNIELLQNGLAIANSTANNRYGTTAMAALNQAKEQKLHIYSGEKDPDFYYGEAIELTLKELRLNIQDYEGMKVAFNGIVTMNGSNSVYVECYDSETDLYFGMCVYYGFNLPGAGLEILSVGNEVRIVGTVQYYEPTKSYQISGLSYRMMNPDDPGNIQKISDGHQGAFVPTDVATFVNGRISIETAEGPVEYPYAALAMNSSIEMKELKVQQVSTTNDPESASYGAMTLSCEADGLPVTVRTAVLTDANGNLITEDAYLGKTIDVRGIIEASNDAYQIKVYAADAITIHD